MLASTSWHRPQSPAQVSAMYGTQRECSSSVRRSGTSLTRAITSCASLALKRPICSLPMNASAGEMA